MTWNLPSFGFTCFVPACDLDYVLDLSAWSVFNKPAYPVLTSCLLLANYGFSLFFFYLFLNSTLMFSTLTAAECTYNVKHKLCVYT